MNFSSNTWHFTLLIGIAAILSAIIAVFIATQANPFYFEISMRSSQPGKAQIFYDLGSGMNERDSVRQPFAAGQSASTYRFPLPPGEYRAVRVDPIEQGNGSAITIYGMGIIDSSGRVVRKFSPADVATYHDISAKQLADDRISLTLNATDSDPKITINLPAPLILRPSVPTFWRSASRIFCYWFVVLASAGVLWLLLVPKLRSRNMEERWMRLVNWSRLHPRRMLLAAAFLSVVASCYPIIFFGRSYIGANIVPMLYASEPTLPGSDEVEAADFNGADSGAMMWQNLPYSFVQSRALAQGELPLWNRYNSSGTVLFGQGLSMFGDPLHMIALVGGGASSAWDIKYLLAKIIFCWGVALLVLATTRHLPTALLLGCSSAFIGFFSYRFNHPAFFSICYAPWLLLCWIEITQTTNRLKTTRWMVLLLVASWAELNSGTAKEAYMLLLSLHGCGLLVLLLVPNVGRWRKLFDLTVIGVVFLLLSTPVCLTFWESLQNSYCPYTGVAAFQIQPGLLIGLFDEIFYRAVNASASVYNPAANFLILLGCILAVVYLRSLLRNSLFVAVAIGGLCSFALAFGVVPAGVIKRVPILNNVWHVDNTFSCALIIELIVIAGFGLRAYWSRCRRTSWRLDFWLVTLVFFVLLTGYLGLTGVSQRPPDSFAPLGEAGGRNTFFYFYSASLILALLALPWLGRALLVRSRLSTVAVPLTFICLLALHWRNGFQLSTGIASIDAHVVNPSSRVNLLAPSPAVSLVKKEPGVFRTVGFGNYLFAGYNGVVGLEAISGPDPLMNRYYRELLSSAGLRLDMVWRWVVEKANLESTLPLYNLLNIRYFLDAPQRPENSVASLTTLASLDLNVYKNTTAWPRAFFTDGLQTYESIDQFLDLVRRSGSQPLAAVQRGETLSTAAPPLASTDSSAHHRVVSARQYRLTNNTTTFTIDAPGAGIAVLTEAYLADDFIARINGIRSEYFRVNHAFRGIKIPGAGTYVISFSYWPKHFTLSLLMAGGGAVLLAGWLFLAYRRKETGSAVTGQQTPG